MKSSWDWIARYADNAVATDNLPQLRLCQISAWVDQISPSDPAAKLALYRQGKELARQLQEPWWEMFYTHWEIEILLHRQSRPQEALDVAARAVTEIRKPVYDRFPQRCALQLNLISCYLYLDPIGHEAQLRAAFAPLRAECAQWSEFKCYYAQQWGHFLNDIEDAEAPDAAWEYLRLAQESQVGWDLKCALTLLCLVLWRCDRPLAHQIGAEIAADAEVLAREEEQLDDIAMMQMWQAVAARQRGDEEVAQTFYRRAWQTQSRTPPPRNDVHGAAIIFHELQGEWRDALGVCQREIRILRRHELRFLEVKRRLTKCELLQRAGRPIAREVQRTRAAAATLKSRAHWDAKLDALLQSPPNSVF